MTKNKYKILENGIIKKIDENGIEYFIPLDPANSDYQAYLEHEASTK